MRHFYPTALVPNKKLIILCVAQFVLIWFIGILILKDITKNLEGVYNLEHVNHWNVIVPCEYDRPGQMGKPVEIPNSLSKDILESMELDNQLYGFSKYRSDLIGYRRTLPDYRHEWCKVPNRFRKDLPSTSIIIPVYNEAWSTLVRTVNSIIINTPPDLLHEIILVLDFEDLPHLKTQLEDHFNNLSFLRSPSIHFPKSPNIPKSVNLPQSSNHPKSNFPKNFNNPKVKIIHAKKREGLIRAKILGAKHATGEVLTFLDSHCECNKGWLEPLLDRIARNSTVVALPSIGNINNSTFEYYAPSLFAVDFNWGLTFKLIPIPEREERRRNHEAEPFYSPIMMGGLFSISRAFFEKLGGYDNGLEIWGAENLEISFKAWMCGGCLEVVPCSIVAHIFKSRNSPHGIASIVMERNLGRIAVVWMDEYVKHFYHQNRRIDLGDLSLQKALREKLKCKTFGWYLKNVFPELLNPDEQPFYGEIKSGLVKNRGLKDNRGTSEEGNKVGWKNVEKPICIDSLGSHYQPVVLFPCHGMKGNQLFLLTKTGEIRQEEYCLDYTGKGIIFYDCHGMQGNQFWMYSIDTKLLFHASSGLCLAVDGSGKSVVMRNCDGKDERQIWILPNFDPSKVNLRENFTIT